MTKGQKQLFWFLLIFTFSAVAGVVYTRVVKGPGKIARLEPAAMSPSPGAPASPKLLRSLGYDEAAPAPTLGEIFAKKFETPFETFPAPDAVLSPNDPQKLVAVDCGSLLDAKSKHFQPPDPDLKAFEARAADCQAVELLKEAKPARQSFVADFKFDESTLALLSPALDLNLSDDETTISQQAESEGKSWQAYNPHLKLKVISPDELQVRDGDEWTATYYLYGRGDFNGDGIEDVMVKREAQVVEGNLVSSKLFVLTRTQPSGILKVIEEY